MACFGVRSIVKNFFKATLLVLSGIFWPHVLVEANGVAQPWPELPAQMDRFLDLTFLVVHRDETQVTECWCPDETGKQELVALGWPEMTIWTREELGERMGDSRLPQRQNNPQECRFANNANSSRKISKDA